MFSRLAAAVVPAFGRLTTTTDVTTLQTPAVLVANHTSPADPAIVLAALCSMDIEPVVLATAGLWRVPVLRYLLDRDGHGPVHRRTSRAADSLDAAAAALAAGRHVLIYGEGRLPGRTDAAEAAPESFRSGPARLSLASGASVVPIGQAGARRVASGSRAKHIAGVLTAPARRPRLHVHVGAPLHLPAGIEAANAVTHQAVVSAWRVAAGQLLEPAALTS